jgi:phosphoribosylamine--glycine ligase
VVLASKGYPGAYDIGRAVTGLEKAAELPDTVVFHGATEVEKGKLLTKGGRVLNVAALGNTLEAALEKAYRGVQIVQFEGKQFRRDIGAHALKFKECHHGR